MPERGQVVEQATGHCLCLFLGVEWPLPALSQARAPGRPARIAESHLGRRSKGDPPRPHTNIGKSGMELSTMRTSEQTPGRQRLGRSDRRSPAVTNVARSLVALLGALLLNGPAVVAADRPNILFIMADDLGYN